MPRFLAIPLAVALMTFAPPVLAESPTQAEMVGTWSIDTSLLYSRIPPTNFFAFTLTLKQDGTFVATNVPADFFFDYTPTPAAKEARGSWKLSVVSEDAEPDHLRLNFTSPYPGSYGTIIRTRWKGIPYISGIRRVIVLPYHTGKKDSVVIHLRKQL